MRRDLEALGRGEYDLLVVGGGIYGAALLREAALAGFSAALVEKGDFCSGTSANSLKIVHGGLRYLQQADLPRVLESVRERRVFLRTAPHLVERLACVMPTRRSLMRSRSVMRAAMLANDILSFDRNCGVDPARRLPAGRLMSRREVGEVLPGLPAADLTGGAVWYDALAYDTERLVIGMVRSAVAAGAAAANHVRCVALRREGGRVAGVVARDELTGREFPVAARVVVNCAGAWAGELLGTLQVPVTRPRCGLAVVMNFVLDRELIRGYAAGLSSDRGRLLFFVPWRGRTMVGTYARWHGERADGMEVGGKDIADFLGDLNQAYPGAKVTREQIALVLAGLMPAHPGRTPADEPAIARHFQIVDHARRDGVRGLITVAGVKYTTARDVAQRALRGAARCLGRGSYPATGTDRRPLPGGDIADVASFFADAARRVPSPVPDAAREHLLRSYGSEYADVLAPARTEPGLLRPLGGSDVLGAAVVFAVREEMAQTLADVVFRRTGLGTAGPPDREALEACASLMARELGWEPARTARELLDLPASVQRHLETSAACARK